MGCFRWGLFALSLWLLPGCSSEEPGSCGGDGGTAEDVSREDGGDGGAGGALRINHIQMKGTHNSYHVAPDPLLSEEWAYTHAPLAEQLDGGVRQLELDIHYRSGEGFLVYHLPVFDDGTTCSTFEGCLGEILGWSDAHPGHHVLVILVEPKDDLDQEPLEGHYGEIDGAILSVWPRERLLCPDDVRGGYGSLREALEAEGWPTVEETRQQALFVLLDNGAHRDGYLDVYPGLEGAALFVRDGEGEAYGAILEHGNAMSSGEAILQAAEAGYLVRTTADSVESTEEENRDRAGAALLSGAHMISTNEPLPREGFWLDLSGGTPSRCNPVTAPLGCTAEAIESL